MFIWYVFGLFSLHVLPVDVLYLSFELSILSVEIGCGLGEIAPPQQFLDLLIDKENFFLADLNRKGYTVLDRFQNKRSLIAGTKSRIIGWRVVFSQFKRKCIRLPAPEKSPKSFCPVGIYLLKVNSTNTGTTCEIYSKLTIKTMASFWCLYC